MTPGPPQVCGGGAEQGMESGFPAPLCRSGFPGGSCCVEQTDGHGYSRFLVIWFSSCVAASNISKSPTGERWHVFLLPLLLIQALRSCPEFTNAKTKKHQVSWRRGKLVHFNQIPRGAGSHVTFLADRRRWSASKNVPFITSHTFTHFR